MALTQVQGAMVGPTGFANLSGITFPATQVPSADANTLDDYEEGTWTPTLTTANLGTYPISINSATYTKIGRVVYLSANFNVTGTLSGSGGTIQVRGIPFAALSDSQRSTNIFTYNNVFGVPSGIMGIKIGGAGVSSIAELAKADGTGGSVFFTQGVNNGDFVSTGVLQFNIVFETA